MSIVRELKGWPQVYTLADGGTLRLLPHAEKAIPDPNISEDMHRGVSMGFIALMSETPITSSAVEYTVDAEIEEEKEDN